MDLTVIGRELRTRRTAAGRTVASITADAGLSVSYIANLENGRGNPTVAALARLSEALGLRLEITLTPSGPATGLKGTASPDGEAAPRRDAVGWTFASPEVPSSLARLGRTARFRDTMIAGAAALNMDSDDFRRQIVSALATLAQVLGRNLTAADWWRLLDAVLLVMFHPASGSSDASPLSARSYSRSSTMSSQGERDALRQAAVHHGLYRRVRALTSSRNPHGNHPVLCTWPATMSVKRTATLGADDQSWLSAKEENRAYTQQPAGVKQTRVPCRLGHRGSRNGNGWTQHAGDYDG